MIRLGLDEGQSGYAQTSRHSQIIIEDQLPFRRSLLFIPREAHGVDVTTIHGFSVFCL